MKRMFTKLLCGAILTGITSTTVLAAEPLAPPTTAPAQSVFAATPEYHSTPRVEVFPFTAVSGITTFKDWTGRGIQESLQSDISRTGATLILGPHELATKDDPIALAKNDHADLAVTGSYQVVDDQIRVNAHLIDVATNTPVGGFSATGTQTDLFEVEDALGEQLRALLPRPTSIAQSNSDPGVVYQAPAMDYSPPVVNNYYDTPPVTTYVYPDYNYGYDYPFGLGFYGGFGYVYPGYGFRDRGGFDRSHFGANPTFRNPVYRGNTAGGFRGSPAVGGGLRGGGLGGGIRGGGGGGRR